MTIHLLFPFAATLVFTFGALFLKKAANAGVKPFTPVVVVNLIASVMFTGFWYMGGQMPSWFELWQPILVAVLYILGQAFILNAVSYGDVSVAAPVAASKVIMVPMLLTVIGTSTLTKWTWAAAAMAMAGVVLINYVVPKEGRRNVFNTAMLALGGAASFASFDVAVQSFAPSWGLRLVPVSYWFVGLFSLILIPLTDLPKGFRKPLSWNPFMIGSFLVALQACLLVYAIATANDAARINIVYSLRGLWGVVLAWVFADWFGGNESKLPTNIMVARLVGASVLVAAVIITIFETQFS